MDQQTPVEEVRAVPRVSKPRYGRRLPKRVQLTFLLVVALLAFVVLLSHEFGSPLTGPSEQSEQPAATPRTEAARAFTISQRQWATLKILPVESREFRDVTETDGKIALDDDFVTPVFSPYSGRITGLMARAGDLVTTGQPLFAIQASELAQAQNDLITAMATLATGKAQLALAVTNEKRQRELYAAKGASLKDWQQAQFDLATAQGSVNTASIAYASVRNRLRILGKTDADIGEIEAAPDVLRLAVETTVTAPISGTVVQRQIGLGQNIVSASSGGSTPVFQIADLSKVWLVANAREEDAPRLRKGEAIEVSLLAFPGQTFHARLTYVAAAIDPVTHRLPVRAEVDNADGTLKPDMFASFRIVTGEAKRAIAVPEVAVVHEADSAHVWVANPADRSLELRVIQTGRIRDGMVEVQDGLRTGENVVTSGAVFIDRAVTGD